ncbi:type II secretion system F family protein [Pandoraea sp.]|uniref:type II secretion system F family protein n=1 Tax=Pandoraea sp. TaxID=1883445 RepID=UPI00121ACFC8|nr:type II secretion system F family protein [Pandoraea sp.]TAL56673.1 MAG: type II secretion system F family protein [Pandoraea sp.]TAM15494.1 MAG: type II secretion system F family protein [Pandoraea sp.]
MPETQPLKQFSWIGRDAAGQVAQGQIEAAGEAAARVLLRQRGIQAITLQSPRPVREARRSRVRRRDIAFFTRQLGTLLKAGIPLLPALRVIGRGHDNPGFARLIGQIHDDIASGCGLADAFLRHPKHFDTLYCHMLAAGEQGGILDDMLEQLAIYQEKNLALRGKLRAAATYPAAVLLLAVGITIAMLLWVIPAFEDMFSSFGAELPALTKNLIAASHALADHSLWLGSGVLGLVAAVSIGWRHFPSLRNLADRVWLRIPLFGAIARQAILARWSRTLATLFASGVPLVDALSATAGVCGNIIYADATRQIQTAIQSGAALTRAMTDSACFSPLVLQMAAIGEESGTLDRMLIKVADILEDEVSRAVASMSTLIEPIIIVTLGVLIGGMVIAMYLPIFKLGQVV